MTVILRFKAHSHIAKEIPELPAGVTVILRFKAHSQIVKVKAKEKAKISFDVCHFDLF